MDVPEYMSTNGCAAAGCKAILDKVTELFLARSALDAQWSNVDHIVPSPMQTNYSIVILISRQFERRCSGGIELHTREVGL